MTTHAEMVAGVRALLVEMMAEVDRFRARVPVGTFLEANLARHCFKTGQHGQAADHARSVIAKLRGVPDGAVELTGAEYGVVESCVSETAASARRMLTEMREAGNAELATDIEEHEELTAILETLSGVIGTGRAIYIVPRDDEPSLDLEKVQ